MTMLEIFKSKLPQDVEIVKTKGGYYKTEVTLRYRKVTHLLMLHKMCVPGDENYLCDIEICNAMMAIAMKKKDNDMFKAWLKRQQSLIFAHHKSESRTD